MKLATLLSIFLIMSAAGYLLLGLRLMSARQQNRNVAIGFLAVAIAVWVAAGAVEMLATRSAVFAIGRVGHFFGAAFAPVLAYLGFRAYVGKATPAHMTIALLFVPFLSVALAATNASHELMWFLPAANPDGQFLARPEKWGLWYLYVHAPYSCLAAAAAALTLLRNHAAIAPALRTGLLLLTAASILPVASAIAYDSGFGPDTMPLAPIVLAFMLPIYAWLAFGVRVADFSPQAYETVFQHMQDPVVVIDGRQRIVGLNERALSLLDVSEREAMRVPLDAVFGDGSTSVFEAIASGEPQKMMTQSGRFLHVQVSSINTNGKSARGGQVLIFHDVSAVERAQLEVRNTEKLLRTLIDHSVNGILRLRWMKHALQEGMELRCIFANAAAGRFLDIEPDALVDRAADDVVRLSTSGMAIDDAATTLESFRSAVNAGVGIDVEVYHEGGAGGRWLRLICEPVGDDFAATLVDVTHEKAKEQQMESIADTDPLTHVLNRRGFEREASRHLSACSDSACGALLFIDLNGFKQINDTHGHEVGDEILTTAARRLLRSLRSCDIIGRPGGDEFVALVPNVSARIAATLAERIAVTLDEAYSIAKLSLSCPASIGLALYPDNANTLTGLLRAADQAMYRAKARSRDVPNIGGAALLEKAS